MHSAYDEEAIDKQFIKVAKINVKIKSKMS